MDLRLVFKECRISTKNDPNPVHQLIGFLTSLPCNTKRFVGHFLLFLIYKISQLYHVCDFPHANQTHSISPSVFLPLSLSLKTPFWQKPRPSNHPPFPPRSAPYQLHTQTKISRSWYGLGTEWSGDLWEAVPFLPISKTQIHQSSNSQLKAYLLISISYKIS